MSERGPQNGGPGLAETLAGLDEDEQAAFFVLFVRLTLDQWSGENDWRLVMRSIGESIQAIDKHGTAVTALRLILDGASG